MRIPDLKNLSVGHRTALLFIIVLVILLALALFGYLTGGWDVQAQQQKTDLYDGVPFDATLLPLDRKALDEAYHGHLIRLWNVWLTDGAKEATRFRTGLKIARGAYHQATEAIAKREQELQRTK